MTLNAINIEAKFEQLNAAHNEAIGAISEYMTHSEIGPLVRWMMETEANPLTYLPNVGNGGDNAIALASIIRDIASGWDGRGDMALVTVNDEPRIVLGHWFDTKWFDTKWFDPTVTEKPCLTKAEQGILQRSLTNPTKFSPKFTVKALPIKLSDFGKVYDAYVEEMMSRQ